MLCDGFPKTADRGRRSCLTGEVPLMSALMRPSSPLPLDSRDLDSLGSSEDGRIDRLVLAAAQQIAERGAAGATARSIAASAGCSASAINYNYGSIEHLFRAAYAHGLARTRQWMTECASEIAALPPTPAAAPLALEHLLVRWTRDARPLALLYQEGLTGGAEAGADGVALWRDFWLETAPRFGLSETEGRLLHLLFETEALFNLSTWSPALEAGALREVCGHLGAVWLGSGPAPRRGALAHAERTAGG